MLENDNVSDYKKRKRNGKTFGAIAAMGISAATSTVTAESFTEALVGGKVNFDARLRLEIVDQDNALKDAEALTVRTRLGYETGKFYKFWAFGEFEDVRDVGIDDYNSTDNGKTEYSVIADPEVTEVNQGYLGYGGIPGTVLKWGRQRIIYDNARFIGNVGWRQNEQTYDGITFVNTSLPSTTFSYAYITQVNRIFGEDNDNVPGQFEMSNHFVNLAYDGFGFGKFVGYGYFLEFDEAPETSNQTLGLRFSGDTALAEKAKLLYALEYATQSDYDDGSSDIDADYYLAELGLGIKGVTGKLGYELLEGDGTYAFSTPLATVHAFNGWADQFLITPLDGLVDVYASVGGKLKGVKLLAVYHDFSADNGDDDYGTEWNFLAAKKFAKHYTLGVKYATYDADDFSVDTDKFWLWGQAKF